MIRTPDESEWVVDGQPLPPALRARVAAVLDQVVSQVPDIPVAGDRELGGFAAAEAHAELVADAIADALEASPSGALVGALRSVERLRRELGTGAMRHRSEVFARVQSALGRLREVTTVDGMLRQIAEELVHGIGFSRVILSRVRDSRWVPEICIVEGDPEWGAEIVRAGQEQEQMLDHMILETEMVRRRAPMLVLDVQNDPRTHQPIAAASFSRSYVAAPIMPDGRVIGFLHVDGYMQRRHMDEFDRDVLWMFTEGAGYALERTVLLERQQNLREHVRRLTGSIHEALDAVVDADVELDRLEREAGGASRAVRANALADPAAVLTRREHDIARLMATGMTNAEMARRLIISEGTAKTHVSSILRKLGAANRAQAVSRYAELSNPPLKTP